MNQSMNQPTNQSMNQSSINQPTNQLINQTCINSSTHTRYESSSNNHKHYLYTFKRIHSYNYIIYVNVLWTRLPPIKRQELVSVKYYKTVNPDTLI